MAVNPKEFDEDVGECLKQHLMEMDGFDIKSGWKIKVDKFRALFKAMNYNIIDLRYNLPVREKFPHDFKNFSKGNRMTPGRYPHICRYYSDDSYSSANQGTKELVLRYIIFMYDHKSPLRFLYDDLQERKEAASYLAGWKEGDNPRKGVLTDLWNFKKPMYTQFIAEFLLVQDSHEAAMVNVLENVIFTMALPLLANTEKGSQDTDTFLGMQTKKAILTLKWIEVNKKYKELREGIYDRQPEAKEKIQEATDLYNEFVIEPETRRKK